MNINETPIAIEMTLRKDRIADLMYRLLNNDNLDIDVGLSLLYICQKGLDIYKYASVTTTLFNDLDDLSVNGSEEMKTFLNFVHPDSGLTTLETIKHILV